MKANLGFDSMYDLDWEMAISTVRLTFLLFSVTLCLSGECSHLSFKVVSANSANTSDAIQKRTITFDSDQPSSSK